MPDTLLGGIVINEILVDPNTSSTSGFDTNQDGVFDDEDEFVELLNISATAIDISGLELWDAGNGNWFTFPPGTILQPGAHAMVMAGSESATLTGAPDDLFFYAGRNSPLINNGGDNVVALDRINDEYISARYNGDPLDDPTTYSGFSPTAMQSGAGENFGSDIDGNSIQRSPDGADTFVNNETPTPGTTNVCFTGGTQFETAQGFVLIEDIQPGDLLRTHDGRLVAVKWIWAQHWTARDLRENPKLLPIQIKRSAFADGVPKRDMCVSQHHRLLVNSRIAERMFGQSEVLVPAKDLLDVPGVIALQECADVTYYHVLLDVHEVLLAEGLPAESLFLGAEVLKTLSSEAINEICTIFRVSRATLTKTDFGSKWFLASGRRARKLAERHAKNRKSLCGEPSERGPRPEFV